MILDNRFNYKLPNISAAIILKNLFLKKLFPCLREAINKQARKLQAKLVPVRNYHPPTDSLTGVRCRATSVAKKIKHYSRGISKYANALHTQLRVGQSYLNSHGFKINLKEDDLCLCYRSETTSHFLLECFLYQEERESLFTNISKYLPRFHTFSKSKKLDVILSGFNLSNVEPDQRNISVAFAVQNYILKTKRFYDDFI